MGTPDIASGCLQELIDKKYDIIGVVTQPDKQVGRGKKIVFSPVKQVAIENNLPVYQPIKAKEESFVNEIKELNPDVIVVVAYGQILSKEFLEIPKQGCINVHVSLLPKYRGAAPIEWTIINGETESGVTTMYMAKGLDTGDMIEKTVVPIADTDTGVTLHDKLADAGAELILSTLSKLEDHTAIRTPQDDSLSCYASMLKKEMGELDFTKDAASLERLIRGLQPWPVAYTKMNQKTVRIYEASVCEQPEEALEDGTQIVPGMIVRVTKKNFTVACGNGALMIRKLQPEGKKPMDCAAFLAGNKLKTGQMIYE